MPPAVIAGAMLATAAVSATSQIAQGIQAKKGAEAQADELYQEAKIEQFKGNQQIGAQDYKANQTLAQIRASSGAAGIDSSTGSSKVVSDVSANEARLNDLYTRFNANFASSRDIYKASIARYQGGQDQTAGFIGAGGTMLTAALKVGAPNSMGGLGFNPFSGLSGSAPSSVSVGNESVPN